MSTILDKITDRDQKFFNRFRDRRHLVRRPYPGEIETTRRIGVEAAHLWTQLPPGQAWFVFVHQIAKHVRTREFFNCPRDLDTDIGDAEILEILAYIDQSHGVDRSRFRGV